VKDKTAIAGIGQTEFSKQLAPSELELACTAVLNALEDAGIERSEVDGLASYSQESNSEVALARNLGLGDITWFSQVGYGGGAGPGVIGNLAMAVATGQCTVGVAWRSRKRASGAVRRPWSKTGSALIEDIAVNYTRPFGVLRPVDEIALLTRRYMHEFGATREHLANVAVAQRRYANNNPDAMMQARPVVGVYEDWLVVGSSPQSVNKCLATSKGLRASIKESPRFREQGLPITGCVNSVSFSDQTRLGESLAGSCMMAHMFTGMLGDQKEVQPLKLMFGILSRLGPVFAQLNFFESTVTEFTFKGDVGVGRSIVTYKPPPGFANADGALKRDVTPNP